MVEVKEFTWIIENYHMYSWGPGACDFTLFSPVIAVGNPHHSNYYLELAFSSLEGMTYYAIPRVKGSFDGICLCKISVVCAEGKHHEKHRIHHSVTGNFAIVNEKCCLNMGTLTLQCILIFQDATSQHISSVTEFSQNISSLYDSKSLSDITLHTNDKEFFLHKFLLFKIVPKLFQEFKLDGEFKNGRVKVDTISTSVLELLVKYLYRGEMDTISSKEYSLEFRDLIKKSVDKLFTFRSESFSSICTRINVEKRIICQNIDSNKSLNDKSVLFQYYIQFDCASFQISAWFERYPLQCMKINIQRASVLKKSIVLLFNLSLGKDESNPLFQMSGDVQFLSAEKSGKNKPSSFSMPFTQKLWKNKLCTKLTVEVSEGEYSTYSMTLELTNTPLEKKASIFGKGVLRHYISCLYRDAQTKKGNHDVTLLFESIDENVLFAHKAILVAWSPVFASMFDHDMLEKERDEVKISDISFATGKRLVFFMYSGEITKTTCAEDMEIYTAADKYQISSLFKQCSTLLTVHLTANNACDILVLAYHHSDESLLIEVQRFIGINRRAILGSSEWFSLINKYPRLISQVLSNLSGALQ